MIRLTANCNVNIKVCVKHLSLTLYQFFINPLYCHVLYLRIELDFYLAFQTQLGIIIISSKVNAKRVISAFEVLWVFSIDPDGKHLVEFFDQHFIARQWNLLRQKNNNVRKPNWSSKTLAHTLFYDKQWKIVKRILFLTILTCWFAALFAIQFLLRD